MQRVEYKDKNNTYSICNGKLSEMEGVEYSGKVNRKQRTKKNKEECI